jgi:acylglycerol lipase
MYKVLTLLCAVSFMLANPLRVLADDQASITEKSTQRYTFVENGKLSQEVHLPTYEWCTTKAVPDGMVLAIHGLTLHGQSYDILARAFAADNGLGSYYVVAPDLRGFGRNRTSHQFCQGKDCKEIVDYGKTVDDMAKLAKLMKAKYPGVPLYLLGESLGSTICLATAAKVPEQVDGLVLSGTAVMKNSLMFDEPSSILAVSLSLFDPKHRVRLKAFMEKLVSDNPDIINEMRNDPLIPKQLRLGELIKTDLFTAKTVAFAKKVAPNTPILILQGGEDKCVVPAAAIKLSSHLRTSDQTMRWFYAHGHLLLETAYISPVTIDAMTNWFTSHTPHYEHELQEMRDDLHTLGGKPAR